MTMPLTRILEIASLGYHVCLSVLAALARGIVHVAHDHAAALVVGGGCGIAEALGVRLCVLHPTALPSGPCSSEKAHAQAPVPTLTHTH
eukprot:2912921-Alexandrium_andersonii.AAC.1